MRKSILMAFKRIGILLLLTNACHIWSAKAQSKTDSLISLSLGIGSNLFSVSSNPIFIRHTAIPTFAEVGLRAQLIDGDFRRPQDFKQQRNFGFGATGLSKVGNWLFYGSFSYGKNYRDSIKYANVVSPYSGNPFITADAVGGNWRGDGLDANLQLIMPSSKNWYTAISLAYATEQNARDNDPKPLNRLLKYAIRPSVAYKFGLYNTLSILTGYSYLDEMVETGYFADQNPIIYSLRGYGEFTAGPIVTAQRFTKGYGYLLGTDYLFKNKVEFLIGLRYGYQTQDVNDGIAKPVFIGGFDEYKGEAFASYASGSSQNGFTASAKAWFRDATGFDPIFGAINPSYYFSGIDTKIAYWKKRDRSILNFAFYPALSYTNYYEGIAKTDWTSIMLHQDAGFSIINQLTKKTTFGGELKLGYHFNLQKEITINRPTQLSPVLVTPYYQFASTDYFKGTLNLSVTYHNTKVSYQLKTGIDLVNTVDFGNRNTANLSLNLIFLKMQRIKNYQKIVLLMITAILAISCSSTRNNKFTNQTSQSSSYANLSAEDKKLADTLIKKVLDNEGIYTVISGLKPMSSVTELYLDIAAADTSLRGSAKVTDTTNNDLKKLKRYQRIVNTLKFGDLRFMISPYRANQKNQRAIQISVHRKSLVDSLLQVNQSFFGQFGFVPGTSPEILVNTTEYEHKYNRFRAYGYLFGYPEHAVTFFTDASISESKTGTFVKRDFLQIPVFRSEKGHFVYAVPKEYQSSPIDGHILNRAKYFLVKYQAERKKHQRHDGSVRYYELLLKLTK